MAIAELWRLLQQDPAGTHRFYAPAEPAALTQTSRALGVRFSRSFERFQRVCGGAVLFGEEQLLGMGPDCPESLQLAAVTRRLREQGLPSHLLPFAPTEDGVDCFDCRGRMVEGEYPVVFWCADEGTGPSSHESFDEWLFELTEALRSGPPNLEVLPDETALDDETALEDGDDEQTLDDDLPPTGKR